MEINKWIVIFPRIWRCCPSAIRLHKVGYQIKIFGKGSKTSLLTFGGQSYIHSS